MKNVATHLRLKSKLYYYSGNCSDPNTLEEIKRNFVAILNDSEIWSDGCPCSVEHVQVTCREVRRRKKKDVNIYEHVRYACILPRYFKVAYIIQLIKRNSN